MKSFFDSRSSNSSLMRFLVEELVLENDDSRTALQILNLLEYFVVVTFGIDNQDV